ncbi:hypothetical protein L1987_75845 [Smallanthus sonchifolius]|uniref:Uncharacterized protein n=1 Tax=Smallanthus sonchifolius TaxID=185202 RepID=A0ACB9A6K6_9ASTR|nr:hypothetical protein L1987_75845 [Smallanthus sonchifolius]
MTEPSEESLTPPSPVGLYPDSVGRTTTLLLPVTSIHELVSFLEVAFHFDLHPSISNSVNRLLFSQNDPVVPMPSENGDLIQPTID